MPRTVLAVKFLLRLLLSLADAANLFGSKLEVFAGVHTEAIELGTNVCDTNCAGRSSLPVGCKFAPTVARCRLIRAPGLRFTMLRAMGTIFCLCALVFGQRLLSALGIERQDLVSVQLLVAEAHLSLGQVKEAKGLLSAAGRFRFHRSGCSF